MPSSMAPPPKPILVQWIFDTRSWYPEATETRQLEIHASRALALLTDPERAGVLKYYHVRDAKMALASGLLKHLVIAKLAPCPWRSSIVTRDRRTKPVFRDPATGSQPVAFNVTHQNGLVALVAVAHYRHGVVGGAEEEEDEGGDVQVGTDVVCPAERRARDHRILDEEGWAAFVDMHADVFAPSETAYLKYQVLSSSSSSPALPRTGGEAATALEQVNDAKLRAFYALWCLREAYVKLTGEALLADWLKDLEFAKFKAPKPAADDGEKEAASAEENEQVITNIDIRFNGEKVDNVNMCLRSIGPDYMICTAVRTPGRKEDGLSWDLRQPYEVLDLDGVLEFAESH